MIDVEAISRAYGRWPSMMVVGDKVSVPTRCLYPSNSAVIVFVEGGQTSFLVHDDGHAFDELNSAGPVVVGGTVSLRHIVSRQGLTMTALGVIQTPLLSIEDVPGAIDLVANVSKECAHYLMDHHRPRAPRSIRDVLEEMLDRQFPNQWYRQVSWTGHSNKPHKFDYDLRLPRERHVVMDVVTPESSSMNSTIVSHLDLRQADIRDVQQRIIYDDADKWRAADLSLLQVGAPAIPLSSASEVLRRMAA